MRLAIASLCSIVPAAAATAAGADAAQAAAPWRAITQLDVEAGYALLKENHPGAVPEAGDAAFVSRLEAGHARALARAGTVTSYEGYVATLGEFANGMGDGHIWSNPRFLPRTVHWAGIVTARRGAGWVVATEDPGVTGARLLGARLVECDGTPADALAYEALHFRTGTAVQAQLVMRGAWLLIDEGNPFLARPRTCVFEQGQARVKAELHWTAIGRDALLARHWDRPYGAAGYGVRASGDGWWIAVQGLEPRAQPVVDAVVARQAEIRSARYAVVDLRGNGGGNDAYGRALAEAIYGQARVVSVLGARDAASGGCDSVFRASPGNIESVGADAERFRRNGDATGALEYDNAVRAMKAAAAAGQALAGDPLCKETTSSRAPDAPSLMQGKVFVLSDAACFSSCISTVEFFRRLGAIHIGQATNADTHYSEVGEVVLPSGLATFSTLRALMAGQPAQLGPWSPRLEFPGDIADTQALEKWVAGTAMATLATARDPSS